MQFLLIRNLLRPRLNFCSGNDFIIFLFLVSPSRLKSHTHTLSGVFHARSAALIPPGRLWRSSEEWGVNSGDTDSKRNNSSLLLTGKLLTESRREAVCPPLTPSPFTAPRSGLIPQTRIREELLSVSPLVLIHTAPSEALLIDSMCWISDRVAHFFTPEMDDGSVGGPYAVACRSVRPDTLR